MAVCMKLSPHICEDQPDECLNGKARTVGHGLNSTVISIRLSDDQARALKKLAGNYDSIGAYIKERLIEGEALRKR